MENDKEVLEVEIELGSAEKQTLEVQECEYWNEIKDGTRCLVNLVNGELMLLIVHEACEDEGLFFSYQGGSTNLHYDAQLISKIYTEVQTEFT